MLKESKQQLNTPTHSVVLVTLSKLFSDFLPLTQNVHIHVLILVAAISINENHITTFQILTKKGSRYDQKKIEKLPHTDITHHAGTMILKSSRSRHKYYPRSRERSSD